MSLGKTLFNFLLLTIAQAIIFKLAESFELLFDFGYLSVLIILFLVFAFIFTYFFYPKKPERVFSLIHSSIGIVAQYSYS